MAVAQQRLDASSTSDMAPLSFELADASSHPFAQQHFDLLFSRFGVMFFEQPEQSFAHMHGALRQGGRLAFCCWQSMKANDWTEKQALDAVREHRADAKPIDGFLRQLSIFRKMDCKVDPAHPEYARLSASTKAIKRSRSKPNVRRK